MLVIAVMRSGSVNAGHSHQWDRMWLPAKISGSSKSFLTKQHVVTMPIGEAVDKKIVGFSYYNNIYYPSKKQNRYWSGIKGNLDLMPLLYPGWIMRLYIDLDTNDPTLADLHKLVSSNPNIDLCHVQNLPQTEIKNISDSLGANWRFYPALDPQVKLLLNNNDTSIKYMHMAIKNTCRKGFSLIKQ